ncbi:hypothetical protein V8C86DRAFT_213858 [Haematococcus lacustris]
MQGSTQWPGGLASLITHPQLHLQLQRLDLSSTRTKQLQRPEQPGAVTLNNLFQGIRLKQLSLYTGDQHQGGAVSLLKALGSLPELEVLTVKGAGSTRGLPELLPALPRLHTLLFPDAGLSSQQEFDALLAATQLTSLLLSDVKWLTESRAERACSWQRLEVTGTLDYTSAAYLPLHSLTQPLLVGKLRYSNYRYCDEEHDENDEYEVMGDVSEVVAAAVHNLTQACRVPVKIKVLSLGLNSMHVSAPSSGAAGVQKRKGWPLVSLVQPLAGRLEKVVFFKMYGLDAADVPALAQLCEGCTGLEFWAGCHRPSLKLWRQLVQSMPTVSSVMFRRVYDACSVPMFKVLKQLGKQGWAQHLDVTILPHRDELQHEHRVERRECRTSNSLYSKAVPGQFRVWFRVQ